MITTVLGTLGVRDGVPRCFIWIAKKIDERDSEKLKDKQDLLSSLMDRVDQLEKLVKECEARHSKREEEEKQRSDIQTQKILDLTTELTRAKTQIEMIENRENVRVMGLEKVLENKNDNSLTTP